MGKQKEKMQEINDFEAFINDTSGKGNVSVFSCAMDTRQFGTVETNNAETKVIITVENNNGDSEMLFLDEENAMRFASAILSRASELK